MKHSIASYRPKPIFALLLALSLISAFFLLSPAPATAQTAVNQCSNVDQGGGRAVECHYRVMNNLNGNQTSSTVESQVCTGTPTTKTCGAWTTTNSTSLVTTVSQCNNSGTGGGATIFCTVEVVNNITGNTTTTAATVNQCNGSGAGGGTEPTVVCSPTGATTNATVTQCNGVANGGGGTERVQCTVESASTTTALLTVRVNQCNVPNTTMPGTYVTCRTSITNNVTAQQAEPTATPTPTPTPTVSPTPTPTASPTPTEAPVESPDATPEALPAIPIDNPDTTIPVAAPADDAVAAPPASGGTPSGGGGTPAVGGGTPSAGGGTPSGGLTGGQISRVPVGAAATGGGSTAGVENAWMLLTGLVLLMAAGSAGAVRQRVHADS